MKRFFLALVITCVSAAASVTLRGQGTAAPKPAAKAGLPSCDANNGGLTLPPGFCALVVHEGGIGEGRHIVVNDNGDIYVILRRGARPSPNEPFSARRDRRTARYERRRQSRCRQREIRDGRGYRSRAAKRLPVLRRDHAHRPLQADAGRVEACRSGGDRRR